jgi:hypothetical protein
VKGRVFRDIDGDTLFRPAADIGAVRSHAEPHLERRQLMKSLVLIHAARLSCFRGKGKATDAAPGN